MPSQYLQIFCPNIRYVEKRFRLKWQFFRLNSKNCQCVGPSFLNYFKKKMPPNILNSTIWQQAEILMQPAFIRIVDNIRKHLDISKWKGSYHDVLIWPAGTTDETKSIVIQLLEDSKKRHSGRFTSY